MERVAIYIRVSTEEQAVHGLSLEAQRDSLIKYAKEHNYSIVDIYADEGITARKKMGNRKELQRLLGDIDAGLIDIVLVTKLDRWFRNIRDYYKVQEILEKNNCNWKTIYENYDTSTASGRLHINIMLSVNQDECDRTSERIKAVFKHKVEQGQAITGNVALGYKVNDAKQIVIVEEEAALVRQIFDYCELCCSVNATQRYISENVRYLSYNSVRRLLTNRIYTGEYRGNMDYCEPIISREQFERVQRELARNVRQHNKYDAVFVFSGLLKCKNCGRNFAGNGHIKTKKGIEFLYKSYHCPLRKRDHACSNSRSISENFLERYLLEHVREELEQYKIQAELKEKKRKSVDVDGKRKKLEKKLIRLKDLYVDELIDKETYRRDFEDINRQLAELQAQTLEPSHIDTSAVEQILNSDFLTIYSDLDDVEKRYLWRSIIDKIVIGSDSREDIQIVFK